ncbi:hypothetical protein LWI29_006016 [Acer saccharum]|uniref:Uncharacterized protein n=1 Tax=Acer saccharum TaxID=4024 RepID=A0AA39SBS3_ACESA|nr:hypothetical protein LWI29_006016 [Acer saccharum]
MGSTSLENLSIEYCKSLMYIARNRLPSNLKRLGIGGCDNLRGLMQEENNNLPATLEVIGIHNCLKLESIAERFENHTALKTINISDCESLKSLPTGGDLPYMNLTSLHIRNYDGNLYDFINLQKLRSLITKKRTSTPLPSPSTKDTSIDGDNREDFNCTGDNREDFHGTGDNLEDFDGSHTTSATRPTVLVNHDLRRLSFIVNHIPSLDQITDIFAKPLATPRFQYSRDKLTVMDTSLSLIGNVRDNDWKLIKVDNQSKSLQVNKSKATYDGHRPTTGLQEEHALMDL